MSFDYIMLLFYKEENIERGSMTFIEFKKRLLDAEISLPKFSKLIKVSEKNIQSYKKKGEVPNAIAAIAECFAQMHQNEMDYRSIIESLQLEAKTKKGAGFAKTKKKLIQKEEIPTVK